MQSAIELNNIIKDYPAQRTFGQLLRRPFRRPMKRALDGVTITIQPGQVVALLGPNGSGKTTCVKLIAGLVRATSGQALVAGIDVGKHVARAQAHVGYVTGDERSFYWRLSIRENLRFFGALHDVPGPQLLARIDGLLKTLKLEDISNAPFRTLSSGQKARVAIARGLLHMPSALLLDEVTRSLDPGSADRLRRFVLDELADRRKMGILLTTHDLVEARALASRIVLLRNGRVEADGPYAQVQDALEAAFFTDTVDSESAP